MSLTARCARAIVEGCDRGYRWLNRLDAPSAQVGPALCVVVRSNRRGRRLADGTVVGRGDPVGVLHLNNRRTAALHGIGLPPRAVGFVFRRRFVTSLETLAGRAAAGGSLAGVRAFYAVTILTGLERVGFAEVVGDSMPAGRLIAAYQRALLAALHPAGRDRLRPATYRRVRRLWISRARLLALHATSLPKAASLGTDRAADSDHAAG